MSRYIQIPVVDPEGERGIVLATSRFLDQPERDRIVRLANGRELLVRSDLLTREPDGAYRLSVPFHELLNPAPAPPSPQPERPSRNATQDAVIPVVAEELRVDREAVETGRIRVQKRIETSEAVVDEPIVEEGYDIERIPVNRLVDAPVEPRHEGETLILPVLEEVLVVEKRLILREEMRITRRRREVHDPQTHTVRRERLDVERIR